jgi:hypothetical protein
MARWCDDGLLEETGHFDSPFTRALTQCIAIFDATATGGNVELRIECAFGRGYLFLHGRL